jgi:hypothetical protein
MHEPLERAQLHWGIIHGTPLLVFHVDIANLDAKNKVKSLRVLELVTDLRCCLFTFILSQSRFEGCSCCLVHVFDLSNMEFYSSSYFCKMHSETAYLSEYSSYLSNWLFGFEQD